MKSEMRSSRIIGILLLVQLTGFILPFVLLQPLTTGPAGFLENADKASFQIKLAVFLLFANCALTIGIAIAAMPIFRRYSEAMTLWLVILSVIMFLLQAVDNVHILSMLSLSRQSVQAGGSAELFQTLATVVGSTRKWAHLTELLFIDSWIFLLYSMLYRFALVPRALAAFGLLTVMLHFLGIPLPGFLGYSIVTPMGVSMAFGHIALAGWLMFKGFEERPRRFHTEAHSAAYRTYAQS